jgi:isoamylase
MINAYREALAFDLPQMPAVILAGWWRWIDTARESPEDIMDALTAPLVRGTQYRVAPRSVARQQHPRRQIDILVTGPG